MGVEDLMMMTAYVGSWRRRLGKPALDYGQVSHRGVHHASVFLVSVLGYYDVPTPGFGFVVLVVLDLLDALVYGEGHAVAGDDGVEDDEGGGEFLGHALEELDDLGREWA